MLEHHGLGLHPVAFGAGFVQARHAKPARMFHDVHAVRIVALDAVHFAFENGVMLGEMKFSFDVGMTFQAGRRFTGRD